MILEQDKRTKDFIIYHSMHTYLVIYKTFVKNILSKKNKESMKFFFFMATQIPLEWVNFSHEYYNFS